MPLFQSVVLETAHIDEIRRLTDGQEKSLLDDIVVSKIADIDFDLIKHALEGWVSMTTVLKSILDEMTKAYAASPEGHLDADPVVQQIRKVLAVVEAAPKKFSE